MENINAKEFARLTPEALGNRLRDLRIARELTQAEVARKAGVHQAYISFVERGHKDLRKVRPKYAMAVLKGYGLDEETAQEVIRLWRERGMSKQLLVVRKHEPSETVAKEGVHPVHVPIWGEEEAIPIYHPSLENTRSILGVKLRGDFAEPLVYEGDLVLVRDIQGSIEGKLVAVNSPTRGVLIGKLFAGESGGYILSSPNPKYADVPLTGEDEVLGEVFLVIRQVGG